MRRVLLIFVICSILLLSACSTVDPRQRISEAITNLDSVYCFGITTDGETIFNLEQLWLLGNEYMRVSKVPAGNRTTTEILVNNQYYSGMIADDLEYPLERQYTWNDLALTWQANSPITIDDDVVCTKNENGFEEYQQKSGDTTIIYRIFNQKLTSISYYGSIPVVNTTNGKATEKELKKTYYFIYFSDAEIKKLLLDSCPAQE